MQNRAAENRVFWRALTAALSLHALLLLIPSVRHAVFEADVQPGLQVRLGRHSPHAVILPEAPEELPEPVAVQAVRRDVPPIRRPEPAREVPAVKEPDPAPVSAPRLLSNQFNYEETAVPLAGISKTPDADAEAAFHFRERANLEMALNEPSLQLPFEDTRIYLVSSYDDGIMGSVDRFFDRVTVPFGFTTKHGTRVECAWAIVIMGCGWGPVRTYYRGQQAKRRTSE